MRRIPPIEAGPQPVGEVAAPVSPSSPWVDSVWDAVHTLIRPVSGAFIAVASLGEATPMTEGLMALLGGSVAAGAHLSKAGTRAVVNTSPEPVSNWAHVRLNSNDGASITRTPFLS